MLRRRCLGPIYVHTLAHHALSEQPPRHAQLYSFDKQHCQTGPFGWSADDSQLVVILVLNVYKPRGMTRHGWRKQREEERNKEAG